MKRAIFIALCFAFLIASVVQSPTNPDKSGTKWRGEQEIVKPGKVPTIAIPGIQRMYFKANETAQKVNIYNPDTNTASIAFSLIVDGETIWKSEPTTPGYGYYDIELTHPLEPGEYQATLLHECSRDGARLNSAKIDFTLEVS